MTLLKICNTGSWVKCKSRVWVRYKSDRVEINILNDQVSNKLRQFKIGQILLKLCPKARKVGGKICICGWKYLHWWLIRSGAQKKTFKLAAHTFRAIWLRRQTTTIIREEVVNRAPRKGKRVQDEKKRIAAASKSKKAPKKWCSQSNRIWKSHSRRWVGEC